VPSRKRCCFVFCFFFLSSFSSSPASSFSQVRELVERCARTPYSALALRPDVGLGGPSRMLRDVTCRRILARLQPLLPGHLAARAPSLLYSMSVDGLAFATFFARAAAADVADSVLLLKVRPAQRSRSPRDAQSPRGVESARAGAAETSVVGCFSSGRWRDMGSRSFGR
jgi:hypothetical protein